ncbi:hypothetical protein D1007_12256 [Hordeum vulgare]|nr:hypothetical protein D1007_12256 [Hordeum vulgare]
MEIMSIAIEGRKYIQELEAHLEEQEATIETMEGHGRDYADEIAELSQVLENEQTTKESLEETFYLELSRLKESHDRALEVANDFSTKIDKLEVAHAKLLVDYEHLENDSRAMKSSLIKLTESHAELEASYSKELAKLPWTTRYPAQCHIYPKVQQVVKQQKDGVTETLKKKILEGPVMSENIEYPDGQGLTRFFSNACYSCGEEGHYSQDCTKGSQEYLGNFPTEEVEFDPLEIEELAKTKESRKKKKYPRKSQTSADIDLSHVRCYKSAMEAIRQIGEILEARLRHTQEYLSEVCAEMTEMKLMTTVMKQKMDDFKEHLGKFQWN